MTFPDFIGLIGVFFVVGTYLLSQLGRMAVDTPLYPLVNGIGALLILFSLRYTFNMASFVIELVWFAISVIGLGRALFLAKNKR